MNSQRFLYIIKQHNDSTIEKTISGFQLLIKYYRDNKFNNLIDNAAEVGLIKVLEWGVLQDPKILPTNGVRGGMNSACLNAHMNILEWGARRTPPLLPNGIGMNWACNNGHMEILEWGENRGLLPCKYGMKWACIYDHINVLNWGEVRGILPDQEAMQEASYKCLKWGEVRGILPRLSSRSYRKYNHPDIWEGR